MTARFIQIHTLTSYPASLLNRDDAGFAKRIPFGGAVRTRVSSQCLKRHWRTYEGEWSLKSIEAPESVRSRISFERYVAEPLVAEGVKEAIARAAAKKIQEKLLGSEEKKKKDQGNGKGAKGKRAATGAEAATAKEGAPEFDIVMTGQVTVLGRPELDYLRSLALSACKKASSPEEAVGLLDKEMSKKGMAENLAALCPGKLAAGLSAALFGRMVTGDYLARSDAAIHVAHALTVHGQLTESDYFSAVDELLREEGETGSGHINSSELTSGLFYGYVVVDVEGLVSNLGGDRALAGKVVHNLIHTMATVSPGAKRGSTAPYATAHLVLVEAGRAQPRTLANAFLEPIRVQPGMVRAAYRALADFLEEHDRMYGRPPSEQRVHAGLKTEGIFGGESKTLAEVAKWAEARVLE